MRKILSATMIAGAALLVSACGGEKTTNTANATMGTDTYNSMDSMGGNAMGGDMMGGNMSGGNMSGDMMGNMSGNMSGDSMGNMSGNMSGGNTMNKM